MRFLILFLFLLNFAAGVAFINEGLFHHDSVVLAQAVEKTYDTGLLQPAIRGRYGAVIINFIISWPFLAAGHNADLPIRLSGILFHALSIVAMFLFVKELFGDKVQALFAALLLSFTPFYFSPNTYGKEHGASVTFLILAFMLLYRGANKKNLLLIGLSSIVFVFSIAIRESMLVMVPMFFLLYFSPELSLRPFKFVFPRERIVPKMLLSFLAPFFLCFSFIFCTYFRDEIYKAVFIRDMSSSYFLGIFSKTFFTMALRDLFVSIPPLLYLFFLLGAYKMIKDKRRFLWWFLFSWFLLLFYVGNIHGYTARYLDVIIIPFYIFASYALSGMYKKFRIAAIALVAFFVFLMCGFMYPLLSFRHGYNGQKHFASFVKDKTEENALIIAMDEAPFINYYGRRKTISHPVMAPEKMEGFIARIKTCLNNGIPVYLIHSGLFYDNDLALSKAINGNFELVCVGRAINEDYHQSEIRFNIWNERLYKVILKDRKIFSDIKFGIIGEKSRLV